MKQFYRTSLVGLMIGFAFLSCKNQENEVQLSQFMFCKEFANMNVLVETDSLQKQFFIHLDPDASTSVENWNLAGEICSSRQGVDLLNDLSSQYKNKGGLQVKITKTDTKGCRQVYHRVPSLLE